MSEQLDPQGVDVREILDANRLTISNLANDFYQAGGVPNKEIEGFLQATIEQRAGTFDGKPIEFWGQNREAIEKGLIDFVLDHPQYDARLISHLYNQVMDLQGPADPWQSGIGHPQFSLREALGYAQVSERQWRVIQLLHSEQSARATNERLATEVHGDIQSTVDL